MAILSERIKERRRIMGLKAEDVAEKIGVSRATLYRYESSPNDKIPTNILEKLAKILGTTREYLIGIEDQRNEWLKNNAIPLSEITRRPIIGVVRAGTGGIIYEEELGKEFVETAAMKGYNPEDFFWLKVKGDSMEPRLFENDLVLVRKQSSVDSGTYAIVLVDDEEGVVKKVVYDESSVTLVSQNHNYPPRTFRDKDALRVRIVGQVIKSQCSF